MVFRRRISARRAPYRRRVSASRSTRRAPSGSAIVRALARIAARPAAARPRMMRRVGVSRTRAHPSTRGTGYNPPPGRR